nr:thioredoxin domain-containing protein [uncultured Flavobacterium sp.]
MNELKFETSPYLLQHKNNPIYWKAWNQDSLQQAQTQNKLLVISIGYSACHWCHVMEHECFEDNDVAEIMNEHFVSIKVDREERPDVDAIYMKALQLMIRQGGWPLNVVCLPDGRPVWGATYVNKQNWIESLIELQALSENSKDRMIEYADKLQLGINHIGLIDAPDVENPFDLKITEPLIAKWQKSFDWEFGGPARAPKFMMPTNLNFLQNYGSYTNNPELLSFVDLTLTKMAYGGLFDVVDGGFSRYSVDVRWHIPHFEKMLYDNGQLLQTYALAYKRTQNPIYKNVCYKTYNFIKENWILKNGLVQSAYDADSLDHQNKLQEGAFYYWKKEELQEILKEDFTWFSELYNINDFGYWEHDFYVFIQTQHINEIAEQYGINVADLNAKNNEILLKLKNYRNTNRQFPRLDDKCLTAWNAMFAIGCLECYEAFGDDVFLNSAEKNKNTILNTLLDNETGILYRNYKDNNVTISGFLDDYAFLIKALIKLYQNTLKEEYILESKQLTDYVIDNFYNENIGLFEYKNKNDDKLIATHFEIEDNVIPSSNAIMGQNLWILSIIFEQSYYKKMTQNMLKKVLPSIDYGSAFSDWLQLQLWMQNDFEYFVVTGIDALKLVQLENQKYFGNSLIFATNKQSNIAVFSHKFKPNKNIKYICNNINCTNQIEI